MTFRPSVPVLHFYHNLYYSGHTELDTYVGIYCFQCQEMCNAYKQDVDLMLVYCWTIVCYAVSILNKYSICVSCLQDRYIEIKYLITNLASKGTLTQHWFNVGLPSTALAQH